MMMDDNLKNIKNHFMRLGIKENKNSNSKINNLTDLEKKYDIMLPEIYKEFVILYGDTYIENEIGFKTLEKMEWVNENEFETISTIFGLEEGEDNIEKKYMQYSQRMPSTLFPFADDGHGNLLCLGINNDNIGKVYYWYHEDELEARLMLSSEHLEDIKIDDYWANIYLVAESFPQFITSLERKLEEEIEDINSKVVNFKMKEDFIEKMRLAREKLELEDKKK